MFLYDCMSFVKGRFGWDCLFCLSELVGLSGVVELEV